MQIRDQGSPRVFFYPGTSCQAACTVQQAAALRGNSWLSCQPALCSLSVMSSSPAHWYGILPFAACSGQKTAFGYNCTPEVQQNKLTRPICPNKVFYQRIPFVRSWQSCRGQPHLGNLLSHPAPSEISSVTLNK